MTKGSGEIKDVFISEGSEVKEGDVLFTTNGLETDLQLEQINSYSRRIELLSIAEENATNGTNYFDRYNEEELIVETMLPSSDRPRIHVEDEVALAVGGLLQSEYGTIPGKVISIDEDATIDNEKGNVFFKVKVKPEKTYLEDSKGEKVNLTIGMVTETRVKYEKITYMKYILELVGIKFS